MAEDITYFAVIGPNRTIDNPSGLIRRRHAVGGPIDEAFNRDMVWVFTDALYVQEHGEDFGPDLVEISEDDAQALIGRFRQKWGKTADESAPPA